ADLATVAAGRARIPAYARTSAGAVARVAVGRAESRGARARRPALLRVDARAPHALGRLPGRRARCFECPEGGDSRGRGRLRVARRILHGWPVGPARVPGRAVIRLPAARRYAVGPRPRVR